MKVASKKKGGGPPEKVPPENVSAKKFVKFFFNRVDAIEVHLLANFFEYKNFHATT